MEIHGNLDMMENELRQAVLAAETDFPIDPKPGRWVFKNSVLYFCTEVTGGLPVWVPMSRARTMTRFTQPTAALEWTIPHNLHMSSVFVQVYNESGNWILPDAINTSDIDAATVTFSTPMAGTAIVMRGETEGSPQPLIAFEQAFTGQSVWVVNHQLGYNPIIRVIVGGNEVQPQSIVHNSTMQTTITFSSAQTGTVRCV